MKKNVLLLGVVLIGLLAFMAGCDSGKKEVYMAEVTKYEQQLTTLKEGEAYRFVTDKAINEIFKMLLRDNLYEQYSRTEDFSNFMDKLVIDLFEVVKGLAVITVNTENERLFAHKTKMKNLMSSYSDFVTSYFDFLEGNRSLPDLRKFIDEFERERNLVDAELTSLKIQ